MTAVGRRSSTAVAAMVVATTGLSLFIVPVVGGLLALTGAVLGHAARRHGRASGQRSGEPGRVPGDPGRAFGEPGRGLATAGVAIGWIGVVASAIATGLFFWIIAITPQPVCAFVPCDPAPAPS